MLEIIMVMRNICQVDIAQNHFRLHACAGK